jgi:hypothetical protein
MKRRAENGLTVGILGVAAFLAASLKRFASSFAAYFELYRRARIALTLAMGEKRDTLCMSICTEAKCYTYLPSFL